MEKPKKLVRLLVCVCLPFIMSVFSTEVWAEYPEKPITIIVTYAAGGPGDMCCRTISPLAENILGQPIVVENKPGGGGTVGLAILANAKPDGYTLGHATHGGLVRQPQTLKVTYKPLKSFTPIIAYAAMQNSICVRKDAPWKSFRELLDYAKKNPNKIRYSTGGVGTGMHQAMLVPELKEGIKWIHIPYNGNAPAMTALLGEHVDVCSGGPEIFPNERSGQVRILVIAESKRHPNYPEIPTLKELGYEFSNDTFTNILGPAGLPPDVTKKLETAFAKAAESKELKALFDRLDMIPVSYVGKDYYRIMESTWSDTEKSLKEVGLIKEPATSPY